MSKTRPAPHMRWKNILYNIAFALTCLLIFLLVFEKHLQVSPWIQVIGRFHPLFLHIPIGLLILYAVAELFSLRKADPLFIEFKDGLLLVTTLCIAVTALMGLFLSKEDGYDQDGLALHKWSGTIMCFILLGWYTWRQALRRNAVVNKLIAIASIIGITITGHFGGEITHGENYVLAPLNKSKVTPDIPLEDAIVFRDMIQPILQEKCLSCHNNAKAKGELVMETTQLMLKGGKNGKLWDTTENDLGLLLHRINLPVEHEDHMPPKRKPQLTETEKLIFKSWVKDGSSFTMKVSELKESDTLKTIAATMFSNGDKETYTFEKADPKVIRSLNNYYRVIQPIAEGSPALTVNFFGRSKFSANAIKELSPIKEQVVEMDLSRMPVDDAHLKELTSFSNLRKINLAFTNLKGDGLSGLKNLKHLKEISLSGTNVNEHALDSLRKFPALRKVFIWNVPLISAKNIAMLEKDTGKVKFETGYVNDTLVLKLTPPMVRNEEFVLTEPTDLLLKHNINGVQIRYTLDGTVPDSINSPVYNNDVRITKNVVVKTKVFRKGWISSDVLTVPFFFSSAKPKEVGLLMSPNELFQAGGAASLFDKTLGGTATTSGGWLGFKDKLLFEATMDFDKEIHAKTITLSTLFSSEANVFPPESITIWYGKEKDQWKQLPVMHPKPPNKKGENANMSFVFNMPDNEFRYLKVRAVPTHRVPVWQSKKPDNGWLFLDEIIVN